MPKSTKKSDLAVESEYASFTIPELKKMAKAKDIVIPSGTRKGDIIRMLEDNESKKVISKKKVSPKKKSPKKSSPKKSSGKMYSPGTLKSTAVGKLRTICKELKINDCSGSKYINKADLLKIIEKYQESINKQEKKIEKEKEVVKKQEKKVKEREKKVKEKEIQVEKIIEAVSSGRMTPSQLKCLDMKDRCKGRTSFCDTETGECKGAQYKGPKGKNYIVNKEHKLVGLRKNVDDHIDWWRKPQSSPPSKKTTKTAKKLGKCDDKDNFSRCKEDEVCYKSKCTDPGKIKEYVDKYQLSVDGRTIIADSLSKIQELQNLLGGVIISPQESEKLEEESFLEEPISEREYSSSNLSEEELIVLEEEGPEEKSEEEQFEIPQEGGLSQKTIENIRQEFAKCLASL